MGFSSMRPSRIIVLFLAFTTTFIISDANSDVVCFESEKVALLQFKQDLRDPSNRLSTWVGEDCCKWVGVICDNLTNHVHEIQLANRYAPHYSISNDNDGVSEARRRYGLGGKINPSLVRLKHLRHLDLSYNNFSGIQIPSFIGSLGKLRYLNLSNADFGGVIPSQLGNLSMLQYLDLGYNEYDQHLTVENLQWLSDLSSLQYLDMSSVNLYKAVDWLQVMNTLPSLIELYLSFCSLNRVPFLDDTTSSSVNFTSSLSILDLSYNDFDFSWLSEWVFKLHRLDSLDLSHCDLQSLISDSHSNMTSLRSLNLQDNGFNSTIPNWLYSSDRLQILDMSRNSFRGEIPSAIGNLTSLVSLDLSLNELEGTIPASLGNLNSLVNLGLSTNHLRGTIPTSLGSLCDLRRIDLSSNEFGGEISNFLETFYLCRLHNLESIDFSNNNFSGPIPKSIGRLSSLNELHLSHNKFDGILPENLGLLSMLERVDISYNLLEGVVSEAHFANLTRLKELMANENMLTFKPDRLWVPPFRLEFLGLSSWQLGPQFPLWLRSQVKLQNLDLANTGISDTIPTWFWNISSSIYYLNLSHNQIHGETPRSLYGFSFFQIDLSSNSFNGSLPLISPYILFVDLSNNSFSGSIHQFLCNNTDGPNLLKLLYLGSNLLSGGVPDCWGNWPAMLVLILDNNNLTGNIPSSIGYLTGLYILHLRKNHLSGTLPVSLQNCTELWIVDFDENEFIGSIPTWIGEKLSQLRILNLRLNKFEGNIPHELCHLTYLQILDLAHNNLSGAIPRCFQNLSAMAIKQNSSGLEQLFVDGIPETHLGEYASLVIKGREVEYSTTLGLLASLDLSNNNLTGEIPNEIMRLWGLESFNLSMNRLSGSIPKKIGDMRSLESLDFSMNHLSGAIPPSISSLTFLSHLNLSCNNFTGKIPSGTQLQSLDNSSFVGNKLCGPPLAESCDKDQQAPNIVEHGDEEEDEVEWFFVSMALGFIVGFCVIVGPLLFNISWRIAYFRFFSVIWQKLDDMIFKCRYIFRN